jgi:hypothetical protein
MVRTREETQRLIDENKALMERCTKVASDLFLAERAKAIWIWIGENAEQINGAGYGKPFNIWQHMALTEMFVSVGRVFDEERWGATYCIRAILKLMRVSHLIGRDQFISYLATPNSLRQAFDKLSDSELVERGFEIIARRRPTRDGSAQLKRVMQIRHTEVAHDSEERDQDDRPTFEDVDHLLTWAKDFVGMVGKAFGNHIFKFDDGSYWSDFDVKSSVVGLRRLTHKAGIVIDQGYAETERMLAKLKQDAEG